MLGKGNGSLSGFSLSLIRSALVRQINSNDVVGQSWMLRTVSGESRMPQTQSRLSRMLRTQSGTFQTVSVAGDSQNNAPCVFFVLWMEWITPCLCSVQHNVPDTSIVSGSSLLSHSYIYRLQRSGLIP